MPRFWGDDALDGVLRDEAMSTFRVNNVPYAVPFEFFATSLQQVLTPGGTIQQRIMEALGSKVNYDVMTLVVAEMNRKKEQVRKRLGFMKHGPQCTKDRSSVVGNQGIACCGRHNGRFSVPAAHDGSSASGSEGTNSPGEFRRVVWNSKIQGLTLTQVLTTYLWHNRRKVNDRLKDVVGNIRQLIHLAEISHLQNFGV